MLVLSRKKGEEIVVRVGDKTVRMRIVKVTGATVRVGIEAPEDVPVHRQEVWNRLHPWRGEQRKSLVGS